MILVKIWKFPLRLFLDKIGPKVIFDDQVVRKQAILDYKILVYIVAILD